MKKLFFLPFVFLLPVFLGGCAVSSVSSGDQDLEVIKSANQMFAEQIAGYRDKIEDLQDDNELLLMVEPKNTRISRNDSLITIYQAKIDDLENVSDDFLQRAAGKDKKTKIELRGYDPLEMSEAYMIMKYADNLQSGGSTIGAMNTGTGQLQGIVINTRNETVLAMVEGLGFKQEFLLKPREKQTFVLPSFGRYKTTFTSTYNSNNVACVTKNVGPNYTYHDDEGASYSYMATATRRF